MITTRKGLQGQHQTGIKEVTIMGMPSRIGKMRSPKPPPDLLEDASHVGETILLGIVQGDREQVLSHCHHNAKSMLP